MNSRIMQDNIMYLNEWTKGNEEIRKDITLDGTILKYKDEEKLDIGNYYLPGILENENLRRDIWDSERINGYDLFHIIKVYCQTEDLLRQEQKEYLKYPKIKDIKKEIDANGTIFIAITDEYDKKYRFDTASPDNVIISYNNLKNVKGVVTLEEFGRVLNNDK